MARAANEGLLHYVGQAFLLRWNVLAVAAGAVAAAISGHADVVLPLVAAGELLYLAGLATNSRFQLLIDSRQTDQRQVQDSRQSEQRAGAMLAGLAPADQARFQRLRGLCQELNRLAQAVRPTPADGPAEELQQGGINRLLWVFLKMLHSKGVLEHFFDTIDEREIRAGLARVQQRLDALGPETEDTPAQTKQRHSLQDTLATSSARLENYGRARENYELVQLELDRLYTKIASLAELGINRQDPDFITHEVDSVSASVQSTEQAMNELEFLTGLGTASDEAAPELLRVEQTVGVGR